MSKNMQEPPFKCLVLALLSIESTTDRQALLDECCGVDETLRKQVERFIACEDRLDEFPDVAVQRLAETVQSFQMADPLIGTMIGPYKLREKLGEGGMGAVYVAEQHEPVRRKVALKVVKQGMDTQQVLARFEAERQALALMDHPNIAKVLDAGAASTGQSYFVMELVQGLPLAKYCDQKKLDTYQRAEILLRVCNAVQHAHQKGIIHRDLKPSNVLVANIDGEAVPKVIDFGISKATVRRLTDASIYTEFSQIVGTPMYMSPEQMELGVVDVDTRSDVYSLGVLAYELFAGCKPFDEKVFRAGNLAEIQRVIREEEPKRPSFRISTMKAEAATTVCDLRGSDARRLAHSLRGELDWIVLKSLEKDRSRRFQSASELAADLSRYLNKEAVLACPPSAWYRTTKFIRKYYREVVMAALLIGVMLTATGFSTWQYLVAREAKVNLEELYLEGQEALKAKNAALSEADRERKAAEAINEFFVTNLLRAADPRRSDGEEPTLKDVLEEAEENIATGLEGFPRAQADARSSLGGTYIELGDIDRAKSLLLKAIEYYEQASQPDDTNHRDAYTNLGRCFSAEDDLENAERYWTKAYELAKQSTDPDVPINFLVNLAIVASERGENSRALTLSERIRDHYVQSERSNEVPCLMARNGLAQLLASKGDQEGALIELDAMLTHLTSEYGERSPYVLTVMSNRAAILQALGKPMDAARVASTVLDLQKEVYGSDNIRITQSLGILASSKSDLGELEAALGHVHKFVEIISSETLTNSSRDLFARQLLASVQVNDFSTAAAIKQLRDVDQQYAALVSEDSSQVVRLVDWATTKLLLAKALFQVAKDEEALQATEWVIEALGQQVSDLYSYNARVKYVGACSLKCQILTVNGEHEDALKLIKACIDLKLATVMELKVNWVKAQVLATAGNVEAAWPLMQKTNINSDLGGIPVLLEQLRAYALCAEAIDGQISISESANAIGLADVLQQVQEIQLQAIAEQELNADYVRELWENDRILKRSLKIDGWKPSI